MSKKPNKSTKIIAKQQKTDGNYRKIDDKYLKDIAYLCSRSGKTFKEVSLELGYDKDYIYTLRVRYPELVLYTDDAIKERFKDMAQKGLETMMNLMLYGESEQVRFNAAKEFMHRAGYDPITKVENINKEITVEMLDDE